MGCTTPGRPAALPRLIGRRNAMGKIMIPPPVPRHTGDVYYNEERFIRLMKNGIECLDRPKKPKARPLAVRTIGLCEKDEKFISKAIELYESNIIPDTLRFLKNVIFLPFNLPGYVRRFLGCLRNYR